MRPILEQPIVALASILAWASYVVTSRIGIFDRVAQSVLGT
jgi:hypothetical protein